MLISQMTVFDFKMLISQMTDFDFKGRYSRSPIENTNYSGLQRGWEGWYKEKIFGYSCIGQNPCVWNKILRSLAKSLRFLTNFKSNDSNLGGGGNTV